MVRSTLLTLSLLLCLAGAASVAETTTPDDAAVRQIQDGYIRAWKKSDPGLIAASFTDDGDFINPTGHHATGREAISGFYAQAFAAGYRDSDAGFTPRIAHRVSPGAIIIDGEWYISGAHDTAGKLRPRESGLATAVLVKTEKGWRIAALREQSSASRIVP